MKLAWMWGTRSSWFNLERRHACTVPEIRHRISSELARRRYRIGRISYGHLGCRIDLAASAYVAAAVLIFLFKFSRAQKNSLRLPLK